MCIINTSEQENGGDMVSRRALETLNQNNNMFRAQYISTKVTHFSVSKNKTQVLFFSFPHRFLPGQILSSSVYSSKGKTYTAAKRNFAAVAIQQKIMRYKIVSRKIDNELKNYLKKLYRQKLDFVLHEFQKQP